MRGEAKRKRRAKARSSKKKCVIKNKNKRTVYRTFKRKAVGRRSFFQRLTCLPPPTHTNTPTLPSVSLGSQDPNALATDLSQISLSGGGASAVGSVGNIGGAGGRAAARIGTSRGGMYGPTSRTGPGPSFSLQDVRKGSGGPTSRN